MNCCEFSLISYCLCCAVLLLLASLHVIVAAVLVMFAGAVRVIFVIQLLLLLLSFLKLVLFNLLWYSCLQLFCSSFASRNVICPVFWRRSFFWFQFLLLWLFLYFVALLIVLPQFLGVLVVVWISSKDYKTMRPRVVVGLMLLSYFWVLLFILLLGTAVALLVGLDSSKLFLFYLLCLLPHT